VGVLWHLHQPEYRDPVTGVPVMPWTRLHTLRGYRDLLVESIETGVPWTVNIVPGLWEQILYYAEGGEDEHLTLTRIPADALTAAQVDRIRRTFPAGHPTMRDTPRYRALEDVLAAGQRLDVAGLRDLQVLSTLVWTGATARRDHPVLTELIAKGKHFTPDDKAALLAAQADILAEMPSLLRRFAQTEGPALSTTPLHHPILPLLVDVRHAGRSTENPPDVDFAWPEDALLQLVRGREAMARWAGIEVAGCWPSEGSVSPEVVERVGQAGFSWLATDDGVLARSDGKRLRAGGGGWDLGHGVTGFFRDHALSDRIGFEYARWSPAAAVRDLDHATRQKPGLTVLALDGENPWESYPDAGAAFRRGLVAMLMERGTTLDDAASAAPVGRIHRLHTGSWIGADFRIWAGASADHEAWRLLGHVRAAVEEAEPTVRAVAMEHILAAEGSDWFWWYGPEFDTPFGPMFDAAFRSHVAAAWRAIGQEPPAEVDLPIATGPVRSTVRLPSRPLDPLAGSGDTPLPNPVVWLGAGEWTPAQSAMARGEGVVVRFGWDLRGHLWLRLPEGVASIHVDGEELRVGPDGIVDAGVGEPVRRLAMDGQSVLLGAGDPSDWVV
jgi:alpha-amylase/alpha-mannosidase (GH57 family)